MRETHYDLALVDAGSAGGMSGLEIACQVRAASPATKLVMMTGGRVKGAVQVAGRFGLRSFLTKPFDAGDLDFALHREFELRRPYLFNALVAPPPARSAGAHA